ncbi:hypothetical protein GC170_03610 [bacterium]|nr:hypothetical protein [bacterium]
MPEGKPRPPIASIAAIYFAIAIFCGSMMLPVFSLTFSPLFGILIGVFLSMPFFALGMWLAPVEDKTGNAATSFWQEVPEKDAVLKGVWAVVSILVLGTFVIVPYVVFGLIFLLLPGGDTWPTAIGRNACFLAAIVTSFLTRTFAERAVPNWFRGKVSNEFIEREFGEKPGEKPVTVFRTVLKNLPLLVYSLMALAISFGVLDRIGPFREVHGVGKGKSLMRLVNWYHEYPNTIRLSALIFGLSNIGFLVKRAIDSQKPRDESGRTPRGEGMMR